MAREAKLVIATEDKTKAGIASAKAGMGTLIDAAKESKRQLEGINAVLQLGGWTMMASKAVNALRDITKEARENSAAFKESTKAFDDLRKELGSSIVSAMEPMVAAIGRIAGQWVAARQRAKEYTDALENNATLARAIERADTARANLAKATPLYESAKLQASNQRTTIPPAVEEAYQKLLRENRDATTAEALARDVWKNYYSGEGSGGMGVGSGGLGVPLTPGQTANGLMLGESGLKSWADETAGIFRSLNLSSLIGQTGLVDAVDAMADAIVPAIEDASQRSLGQSDNLSEAALILAPERGGGMGPMFDMSPLGLLGDLLAPLADSFGSMFTALAPIQQILDPLGVVLQGMFEVIGPLITEALAPLIGILKIVGNVLGQVLTPVIKFLGDAIKVVADGLIWVLNGVIQAINWALGWMGVNIAQVSLQSATAAGMATAAPGGGTGATYTGSQPITFNFYNQGNVVGSGGLEELAAIIEGLIQRRARYA